ncbi:MAG: hypothetical protein FWG08_06730 [Propionibacteriaceae bacterium]|jgi:hypothetical protein|nr:hypothetical protein [Propionibacteriaceae bacterium]
MPSRVNLPGAEELFRPTTGVSAPSEPARKKTSGQTEASGRVRHDEKITVYVSSDELIALEQTRLALRKVGISVDRGRIVRAAIASALADFDQQGEKAEIVARLGA